jgi:calcium-dependent protein kinase
VAPEVVDGRAYNEKCDVWSCGIIMFIMLTGRPPYAGRNEKEILENVRLRPFDPLNYKFKGISEDAINLIVQLLNPDIRARISAVQAANHPWVQIYRDEVSSADLSKSVTKLRKFSATYKLKDAVYTFLATNAIAQLELKTLRESFQALDANSDGKLSREELMKLYLRDNDEVQAQREVEAVLEEVDSDKSGYVDYSEFLRACMNHERALSNANLELAFKTFDADESGMISADELKRVLSNGDHLQEEVWREIIREVDANGDGLIDLKEFTHLMTSKI